MRPNGWIALIIALGIVGFFALSHNLFVTFLTPDGAVVDGNLFTVSEGSNVTITGDSSTNTITIAATGSGGSINNAFATVDTPDGNSLSASGEDTLTLAEGLNIEITGDSGTNTATIGVTGTVVAGFNSFNGIGGTLVSRVVPGWGCRSASSLAVTSFQNDLLAIPIVQPGQSTTYSGISVNVANASTAGTTLRMGIYEAQQSGTAYGWLPGDLLIDAGTVSTGSTGAKTITINQELLANTVYFLVFVHDSSANLQLSGCNTGNATWSIFDGGSSAAGNGTNEAGVIINAQGTGALPDPFPTGSIDESLLIDNAFFVKLVY